MKLREHQAKTIFREHGIRVPHGALATDPDGAARVAADLGGPVVLKPQLDRPLERHFREEEGGVQAD